jgi:hypothetical protein
MYQPEQESSLKSNRNRTLVTRTLAVACITVLCTVALADKAERKSDTAKAAINLDSIPSTVTDAAAKTVPGIAVKTAKLRSKRSGVIFKLDGVSGDKQYQLTVDATGKILDVRQSRKAAARTTTRDKVRADKATARRTDKWSSGAQTDPLAAAISPARLVGTLSHEPIRESSGVVASRKHAGVHWTHNDQGNGPVLYAVDAQGKLLAEYPIAAAADDWEDIAIDDTGNLYVGNIGNNKGRRPYLEVYRLAEPDPSKFDRENPPAALGIDRMWRLRFPAEPLNCESLFVHNGYGYLISKLFTNAPAEIYRFPLDRPGEVVLEKVAQLPIRAPVAAADLSADAARLAVLAPDGVHLFDIAGDVARAGSADAKPRIIPVPRAKLEGICFTPDGLLLTAEERHVYHIPN